MKIVTFNINGLRSRLHQLEAIIEQLSPDVIGLQETKVQDADFPVQIILDLGYAVEYHGQKGYYGVATLSKVEMELVQKNFVSENNEAQRRTIVTKHSVNGINWTVLNGYFPQGENRNHPTKFPNKRAYYQNLNHFVEQQDNENLILMGDFNIAPSDADVGLDTTEQWLKKGVCSFLPEEREWYQQLLNKNLIDTWRVKNSDCNNKFSWFDYRTRAFERTIKKGLRIDHILTTKQKADSLKSVGIEYDIRAMEKPSDHVPVWAEFD